ncbi:MAG: hypothetical protein ACMUIP_04070 [bacterium]
MMTKKIILIIVIIFSIIFLATPSARAVPDTINLQGKITYKSGEALNGNYQLEFLLYDQETGGSPLWQELHDNIEIKEGIYTIQLGSADPSGNPLNADYFINNSELYLEMVITEKPTGTPEIFPRQCLTSTAFAMKAADADTAGSVNWTGIVNPPPEIDPTVPEEVKDGIAWNEVTNIPEDIAHCNECVKWNELSQQIPKQYICMKKEAAGNEGYGTMHFGVFNSLPSNCIVAPINNWGVPTDTSDRAGWPWGAWCMCWNASFTIEEPPPPDPCVTEIESIPTNIIGDAFSEDCPSCYPQYFPEGGEYSRFYKFTVPQTSPIRPVRVTISAELPGTGHGSCLTLWRDKKCSCLLDRTGISYGDYVSRLDDDLMPGEYVVELHLISTASLSTPINISFSSEPVPWIREEDTFTILDPDDPSIPQGEVCGVYEDGVRKRHWYAYDVPASNECRVLTITDRTNAICERFGGEYCPQPSEPCCNWSNCWASAQFPMTGIGHLGWAVPGSFSSLNANGCQALLNGKHEDEEPDPTPIPSCPTVYFSVQSPVGDGSCECVRYPNSTVKVFPVLLTDRGDIIFQN